MPKASSEQLFRLIKSLSKSEKRQFRLISMRLSDDQDKKFLRLFDVIERQNKYDEQKILKKIPESPRTQLPNQKAHLNHLLMKSLRFHESKNDTAHELLQLNQRLLPFAGTPPKPECGCCTE